MGLPKKVLHYDRLPLALTIVQLNNLTSYLILILLLCFTLHYNFRGFRCLVPYRISSILILIFPEMYLRTQAVFIILEWSPISPNRGDGILTFNSTIALSE